MKISSGILSLGAAALVLFTGESARGNAVAVTNLALLNASNGFAEVHFDLSWSNSWRTTWTDNGGASFVTNWDGVWIQAKQRVSGGDWGPVYFATNNNFVSGGYVVAVATNGGGTNVGAMIYRSAEGFGGVSLTNVILNWNYAAGGLYGTNQVDLAIFATEMVYIPEGPFYIGDGTPGGGGAQFFQSPNTTAPYLITNENAITLGSATGSLNWVTAGYSGVAAGILSNAFPKGYHSFYAMKYEISQGQYADFLNHISPGRALNRYMGNFGSARQSIVFTNGAYVALAPDRAAIYLSWDDLCVYLDWAGLRPLTELEFEKMCRGFKTPVPGELAFGDITPVFATSFLGVDGSGTETVATASANVCAGSGIGGPVRVGIFATNGSTRISSGAGYFGNMELSGNADDQFVAASDAAGRAFMGENGDGNPVQQPASWPTYALGIGDGFRGGGWSDTLSGGLLVSYRYYAAYSSGRASSSGGRGGRLAP